MVITIYYSFRVFNSRVAIPEVQRVRNFRWHFISRFFFDGGNSGRERDHRWQFKKVSFYKGTGIGTVSPVVVCTGDIRIPLLDASGRG